MEERIASGEQADTWLLEIVRVETQSPLYQYLAEDPAKGITDWAWEARWFPSMEAALGADKLPRPPEGCVWAAREHVFLGGDKPRGY